MNNKTELLKEGNEGQALYRYEKSGVLKRICDTKRLFVYSFGEGEKKVVFFAADKAARDTVYTYFEGVCEAYEKNLQFYGCNFGLAAERYSLLLVCGERSTAIEMAKSLAASAFVEITFEKEGISFYCDGVPLKRAEQLGLIISSVSNIKPLRQKRTASGFNAKSGAISLVIGIGGKSFSLSRFYEALTILPELIR
ncbi:MAG: hypothetical protein IKA51_02940 [Clostridia bacterium]|nr:hypothetical protein [Clostridia bacterium]